MRATDLEPTFLSHAPGYWSEENTEKWSDHKWQLRNRVDSLADLDARLKLTDEERAGVLLAAILYAPGTVLYIWARRERGKPVFSPIDWIILIAVIVAAVVGIYSLATGAITI